jgi:hypothetical protein
VTAPRTKNVDPDFRRDPKTERYCVVCQRDIAPERPAHEVMWLWDESAVVHPDDWHLIPAEDIGGSVHMGLVGPRCRRKLGAEWCQRLKAE